MSQDDLTPEERKEYATYMAQADQAFAWAIEHESEILKMILTKDWTDDPDFLTNMGIVVYHALIRHRADMLKEDA